MESTHFQSLKRSYKNVKAWYARAVDKTMGRSKPAIRTFPGTDLSFVQKR